MARVTFSLLLVVGSCFGTTGYAQEQKHDSVVTERPTAEPIPEFVGSILTKAIELKSLATFVIDRDGNRELVAPVLVLDEAQTIFVEHENTAGDVVWTGLVRSDGREYRFNALGKYPVDAGTYKHYANGTIYGTGNLVSRVTYLRLVPNCSKLTQLTVLGWEEDHKTNFCTARGYTGVTNTSTGGNGYHKNGGGWCYIGQADACQAILDGTTKPSPLFAIERLDGPAPRKPDRSERGGGSDR